MSDLKKRDEAELAAYTTGKLKEVNPDTFKEFLSGLIVHLMELNLQTLPEPSVVDNLAKQLYDLLRRTWPGATRDQVYRTVMFGLTKQADYGNFKLNYPLLSNWLYYQRKLNAPTSTSEKEEKVAPSLNEQAEDILRGLADYRKRKGGADGN
jgi:hypothetical protein